MKRAAISALSALLGVVAWSMPGQADQINRYRISPPVVLSPNLTEPWLLQLRPSQRTTGRYNTERRSIRMPQQRVRAMPERRASRRNAEPRRSRMAQPRRRIDPKYLPQSVSYDGPHGPGTVIIDTKSRFLTLVGSGGQARRYGIGVGRPGFIWSGNVRIARKKEWPSWRPPAAMRKRQPNLPKYMEGGPRNPLGARAMYLYEGNRDTLYRIHGTNEPWTIGHAVSSGCIRMRNEDVIDLYQRVPVGSKVVVL